ncbi:flavodoxin FldB [Oceanospirillum sediminis]|uniref:Flavodoxin n=1 Tax=Oceanospirillum sediminis TaxID=2760088 RepID=A0A839ISM4_9GAMM|nr:flavodoxin FldB [Oceanospirillum sediminis]MBB1487951.1 flavodoxin FldB [Oceanospirillum sediminis]
MIALLYGTTTGNTGDIAEKVQKILGTDNVDLFDVKNADLEVINEYSFIIFAIPTWDYGEVQEDWEEVWEDLDNYDYSDKIMAFIGLGDQLGYGEWFLDAMGMLHKKVVERGATIVGYWPVEGYEFEASLALTDDKSQFVGLALDEDTQREQTDERLEAWCELIKEEMALTV